MLGYFYCFSYAIINRKGCDLMQNSHKEKEPVKVTNSEELYEAIKLGHSVLCVPVEYVINEPINLQNNQTVCG